eukprot:2908140-Pleurochrysis_carterae.AAC.1
MQAKVSLYEHEARMAAFSKLPRWLWLCSAALCAAPLLATVGSVAAAAPPRTEPLSHHSAGSIILRTVKTGIVDRSQALLDLPKHRSCKIALRNLDIYPIPYLSVSTQHGQYFGK